MINHVQEREMRCVFVRESDGISNGQRRGLAEIRGIKNPAKFHLARRSHSNVRANGKYGAIGTAENVFRSGTKDEFADTAATAGTEDDEIGFLCLGDRFNHCRHASFEHDNFSFEWRLNVLECALEVGGVVFELG